MRNNEWVLLLAMGCTDGQETGAVLPSLDMTETLNADQARAGIVHDEDALFGGASADGQLGDIKIYNDRAQFIIQGMRRGHYYIARGGGIIDADMVREPGSIGRDVVDDLHSMAGFARLMEPDSIDVVEDGRNGGAAVVRVVGHGEPLLLLTGALENPDLVPDLSVQFTTDYILEPGSNLLKMDTTVLWQEDESATIQVGDVMVASEDVADNYCSGSGLMNEEGDGQWFGLVGRQNEVAIALLSDSEPWPSSIVGDLLTEIGPVIAGIGLPVLMEAQGQVQFQRYLGVGPDLATLTDEWYAVRDVNTETISGTLTDGSEGVAGARVHVMDSEGSILTMAHSDDSGAWTADVPLGTEVRLQATGRGHARHDGLPEGAGWGTPYAASHLRTATVESMARGAPGAVSFAEGFGITDMVDGGSELQLVAPAFVDIDVGDGLPAMIRIDFLDGDSVSRNASTTIGRPGGSMARAFPADGAIEIPVEPGNYRVVVHRGATWEPWVIDISLVSGQRTTLTPILEEVIRPEGVLRMDPHSHASPSGDGRLSMAHRLLLHAANGIQVHFGTDHDHVADYRPLLEPLGLRSVLTSVLSDEVSPPLRGHHNIYPLEAIPNEPNHGAPLWHEYLWSTEELHAAMRERLGAGGIIQVNHGLDSSGMFGEAGMEPMDGVVYVPDYWSSNFDAMEVLNDGKWQEAVALYMDLVSRGLEPTPVGVSDAHGYSGGEDISYVYVGHSDPALLTDEELIAAMVNHAVVVSKGPYIEVLNDYEWAPGTTTSGPVSIDVKVYAPSWMQIDQLDLWMNGAVIDTVAVAEQDAEAVERIAASFELSPEADAHYVLMAQGSQSMAPVYPGRTAWAMTAAIRVDVDDDGWESPLPSLIVD